ncbi:hypothetical protein F2Q70_00011058 [Brassica cretica]|uniref:GUCT domain-containing protein n=1 Tax=Brassica cretica TaxID=69181 RepID=A0A8S9LWY7_BRACR|nr:hypothetical protein F2Q70_00011058 [Brassica cretica]
MNCARAGVENQNGCKIRTTSGTQNHHVYQQSAEVLLAKALAKIAVDFSLEALSSVVSMPSGESLSEDKVNSIEGLTLTADGQGAVFNVVQSDLDQFIAAGSKNAESLVVAEEAAVDLVVVVMVEARDGENL